MSDHINTAAESAREHARQQDGKFGQQLRGEADNFTPPAHAVPWAGMGDGTRAGKPFMITVEYMFLDDRDQEVSTGEEVEVDVAALIHGMDDAARQKLWGDVDNLYSDEVLSDAAVKHGLVELNSGHLRCDFDDDLGAWLDDNPVWVEDGLTPHPSGGYVTVDGFDSGHDQMWSYLDAAGEQHRLDGPAFIHTDDRSSTEEWRINGRLHRLDGPAMVSVRHRTSEDGNPVIETLTEWWAEGNFVSRTRATTETPAETDGWHLSVDGRRVGRNANHARLKAAGQFGEGQ